MSSFDVSIAQGSIEAVTIKQTKNSLFTYFYLCRGINIKLEGGSRSGKTFGISIALWRWLSQVQGKVVTIGRDTAANLRISAYATMKKVAELMRLPVRFSKNMTDVIYNGNTIRFVGVNDDPDKALGAEQDVFWGNEWITADKAVSDQIEQRTGFCVIFDYNPSEVEHWLYDLDHSPFWRGLKTTLLDNPFVPVKHKRKILSYDPSNPVNVQAGTANKYMWLVYGLGERAIGEDAIFKDIDTYAKDPEQWDWQIYAGDFGYSNDPTAFGRVIKNGNNLYIRQLIYETGLLNPHIAERIIKKGWNDQVSVWDNATGKDVPELRLLGINAVPAVKGYTYVRLEKLKQFNIFVHEDSKETLDEFKSAKWAKDKHGNYKRNSLGHRIMKDSNPKKDHALDFIGYALGFYLDMTGL